MISHSFIYQNNIFQITISFNNLNSHGQTVRDMRGKLMNSTESSFLTLRGGCTYWKYRGKRREWESQAEKKTKEDYESMKCKTQQDYKWENKQAVGCQALALRRYFPLCAQLDLWDSEQYSPHFSQTLTQAGEFSSSMLVCFKNSNG